jgi:hypothetical protein
MMMVRGDAGSESFMQDRGIDHSSRHRAGLRSTVAVTTHEGCEIREAVDATVQTRQSGRFDGWFEPQGLCKDRNQQSSRLASNSNLARRAARVDLLPLPSQ